MDFNFQLALKSNEMKYPESVKIVMREAPLGYAIAACWEYRNKMKTARQILKDWKTYKKATNE